MSCIVSHTGALTAVAQDVSTRVAETYANFYVTVFST